MHWLYLFVAISAEVVATTMLKSAEGFTRLVPSVIVIVGYSLAFYLLSLTLKTMPMGIAYAIWSGIGIAIVAFMGWTLYGQKLDIAAIVGIAFILVGVLIINTLSNSTHT